MTVKKTLIMLMAYYNRLPLQRSIGNVTSMDVLSDPMKTLLQVYAIADK